MTHSRSFRRRAAGVVVALSAGLVTPLVLASQAEADTAPVAPVTTPTVSADALPTVQIDGVVWAQTVIGTKVYATGSFANARPAGAASGTNQTARANILAYDITTGVLDTTFAPTLNAQGLAITHSDDGKIVYVAGDFTSVSGTGRNRVVALDATTGAVIKTFTAGVGGQARALAISGNTLYVGGTFSTALGQARSRLAAFNATTGALLSWAPTVDNTVYAMVAPAGKGEVVIGGRFTTLNGSQARGTGAVSATDGTSLPWALNSVVQDYGNDAAINSMSTDGENVYVTGYGYLIHNDPTTNANLESVAAAKADGGALVWASGCRGDTYSNDVLAGVVYHVGHAHDCSAIGGLPQTNPWSYQRALAFQAAPAADGRVNNGGMFNAQPAPELLHWTPAMSTGSYTGQGQAGWSVSGNSQYLVIGGEFPSVNGKAQQGLVRFGVKSVAPNKEGPQGSTELKPTATSIAPGTLRLSWTAAFDRDNRQLTYEVLRGATTSTATVLATRTQDSVWWTRPSMAFTDRTATPGSTQTYRIRVKDALGNTLTSASTAVTVPDGVASASPYGDAVAADSPSSQWRLGESSGTTAYDWASGDDVTLSSDSTRGVAGALKGDSDAATTFTGAATVPGVSTQNLPGPQTFSLEAWFSTTSTAGGKIVGFGNSNTGASSNYDRHLYLDNSGKVVFGVYNNNTYTLSSSAALNDGKWHHVVGTLGSGGLALYVDGVKQGTRTDDTSAQPFSGYWRIGGDNLNGWPNQPSSSAFAGSIDEVAVYPTVLSDSRVAAHYAAGVGANQPPTASFTANATNLSVAVDATASADADGTISSYSWNWGDSTAAGSGKTTTHAYTAAGDYTVTLTVTDDKGATATTTKTVTATAPPANVNPTASFTATATDLSVAVDATASADTDGTISSYSWNWGDSTAAGSGKTATHAYTTAGDYTVTLTVTDNQGGTGTATKSVTVTAPVTPPAPTVLAADAFGRTTTTGWGTADTGGAWTTSNSSVFKVAGGVGTVSLAAGAGPSVYLNGVSSSATDMKVSLSPDKVTTGNGVYVSIVGRKTSTGAYRGKVRLLANGSVAINVSKVVGTTETNISAEQTLPGVTYTAGAKLVARLQVEGTTTTTLRLKVWPAGGTEPTDWQVVKTDTTSGLQGAGSVGLVAYLSGGATNPPVAINFDDLSATAL